MARRILVTLCLVNIVASFAYGEDQRVADAPAIRIGDQTQLFLDAAVIDSMDGLQRVYGRLEKHPESPVMRRERPWEQGLLHPVYVLFDPDLDLFHMWYGSYPSPGEDGRASLCYARSKDGIRWTRPDLDLVAISPEKGGTPNNILDSGAAVHPAFIDPEASDPSQRIVLLRGGSVWSSPDGIHLEKRGEFPDMRHAPATEPDPQV